MYQVQEGIQKVHLSDKAPAAKTAVGAFFIERTQFEHPCGQHSRRCSLYRPSRRCRPRSGAPSGQPSIHCEFGSSHDGSDRRYTLQNPQRTMLHGSGASLIITGRCRGIVTPAAVQGFSDENLFFLSLPIKSHLKTSGKVNLED